MRGRISDIVDLKQIRIAQLRNMFSLLLKTIMSNLRYNPENIKTLEHYVDLQSREKGLAYLE